jgi:DNA-binding transcriptional MerR regulator
MGYSIGEAAARSGFSVDTLRYYEKIKLIEPPGRDGSGRRVYGEAELAWLGFVAKLRTVEMPIQAMVEYAALQRRGASTVPERTKLLKEQRDAAAGRVAELQACLQLLEAKIQQYERMD